MFKNKIKLNIISLYTLCYKEFYRIFRIWPQTIFPSIIISVLYFFVFGNIMNKKFGEISGYNYAEYIMPGLLMMTIITNSYSNVASSFFGAKFQKNIEELLISPIYDSYIILGFIFGGILRATIVFITVFFISRIFCNIYVYSFLFIIIIYISTAIIFSLIGLINGIFAKRFDDISIIPTFIITPLIYIGGVFYSLDFLPNNFKIVIFFNPMFYLINIFRYGFLGVSEININLAFIIILIFIILTYYFIIYILKNGYEIKK